MTQPDVTVVLTSFEQPFLLAQAVRMMCESMFTAQMELLVVDDASKTGLGQVRKLLARVSDRFHSVRLLQMDRNCGVSVARNTGMEEAKGRYVHFHDGDDLWAPETWSESVKRMDEDDLLVSVTGLRAISGAAYPEFIPPPVPEFVHPMFHYPIDRLPYVHTNLVRRDMKTRFRVAPTRVTKFWDFPTSGEDNFFKIEVCAEDLPRVRYARFGDFKIFRADHWGKGVNPPQWHAPTHSEIVMAAFFVLFANHVDAGLVVESYNWLEDQGFVPSEVVAVLDLSPEDVLGFVPSYRDVPLDAPGL